MIRSTMKRTIDFETTKANDNDNTSSSSVGGIICKSNS